MRPDVLLMRLAAADPAIDEAPEGETAEALLRALLTDSIRAAASGQEPTSDARIHGHRVGARLIRRGVPRRRLARWSALSAAITAAAALLAVGNFGGHPASAFAGWSATPSAPARNQVRDAIADCQHQQGAPTLADTRGPFSLLLFALPNESIYLCTSSSTAAGEEFAGSTTDGGSRPVSLGAGSIAVAARRLRTGGHLYAAYGILYGYVGAEVTGVSLVLTDGSRVQTTTENGLFAAWWPGTQGVQRADVATAAGIVAQTLDIPAVTLPPGLLAPSPDK